MNSHHEKILLTFAVVFFFATSALAQEQKTIPLSLSQALQMALTRNTDLIIADERVNQALARIQEISAPLLPQLRGTISETRQTRDIRSVGIPLPGDPLVGPFNVYDARVRLTQTIFDPGAILRFKASRQGHALSLAQQKKTKDDVLVLVVTLFIQAKRAQDNFGVTAAALRRDKKEMSVSYSRVKSGLGSSLEMKKARAQYAHAVYNFQTARKEALERRLDLAAALDLPRIEEIRFSWDDRLGDKDIPDGEFAEDQPDLNVARQQLAMNEKERNANKWDFWPKIAVSGDYGPSGVKPSDASETYTMGISATIPIFEGGSQQARLKENESALKISQTQLQRMERDLQAQFSTQQAIVSQAQALLQENDSRIAVAAEELQLMRGRFNSGNGSSLDVTSAELNLKLAQDQKDEATAFYVLAKVNLARSLGKVEQFLLEDNGGVK
jgi:outer membrane protein TolC